MTLMFTVGGTRHEVEISEDRELDAALESVDQAVRGACGESSIAPYLTSRLYVAALHALTTQMDQDVGEVLASIADEPLGDPLEE